MPYLNVKMYTNIVWGARRGDPKQKCCHPRVKKLSRCISTQKGYKVVEYSPCIIVFFQSRADRVTFEFGTQLPGNKSTTANHGPPPFPCRFRPKRRSTERSLAQRSTSWQQPAIDPKIPKGRGNRPFWSLLNGQNLQRDRLIWPFETWTFESYDVR